MQTKEELLQHSQLISGTHLPVMEQFYTIQGEGAYSGVPAYFIRLGGCDVGCHWCDVKDSWDFEHQLVAVDDLVKEVKKSGAHWVVITGGEPLIYDLNSLVSALHGIHVKVNIETSGAYPLTGKIDWICFSPKKFKSPQEVFYSQADELKIIIFNSSDFKWAEQHAKKLHNNCKLYLQTEWSKSDEMLPLIIEYVKNNPKWRISLQTHKYMNIP